MKGPTGGDDGLDAAWEKLENDLWVIEEHIENILDAIAAGNSSPALAERLRALEEARDALKGEQETLAAKIGAASSPLVQRRIADFAELLDAGADKAAVNAAMRQLFSKITIDRDGGSLEFSWTHGGESRLTFAWPRQPECAVSGRGDG
jgi:hypothetical protein